MDRRTSNLLDALSHPAAAVLAALAVEDATEAGLVALLNTPQPTVHRRLRRLEEVGLVKRAPGGWRSPNRSYRLVVPDQTRTLLVAAATLADALADLEERERRTMLAELRDAGSAQPHLRRVDQS